MDVSRRMEIERDIERLVTLYCHYVDHGEAARIADLFSKDGSWRGPGTNMQGIEAIRKGFEARQANRARMSRHVCNNLLIDVVDEDNAKATVYLTLYRHDGEEDRRVSPLDGPAMVGEYRDRFVRTSDGWRFADREIDVDFLRPENDGG